MWTRRDLKARAKEVLKISYWKAFVVSLVLFLVGGDSGNGTSGSNFRDGSSDNMYGYFNQPDYGFSLYYNWIFIIIVIAIAFMVFRIMIGYALEVGGRRFFKQAAQMDVDMGYLGYAFKSERYKDVIVTMLYKGVLNFLWYLLLIIPGIVKSYAYSMVPYILADNPNIGYRRAVELSNQMTEGHKFDMFILDLSFIGWYLLGMLLFFIGIFFVKPYENATEAELYLVLRQNAFDNGHCTSAELLMENII
ncbi:MAG: hypothetical protein A2Y23_10105 [Clostridiales bacterium GWB2_37_7]|nr:MAG: hypothetical protein A2Y23_10105 [Clostridiales bacterium GWB2_37_7]